jgi:hypothetical protein
MSFEINWVYVLSNEQQFNSNKRVKIGYSRDPDRRGDELDSGASHPFRLEYAAAMVDARRVEQSVHKALAGFRCNPSREFFDCGIDVAIQKIRELAPEIFKEKLNYVFQDESIEIKRVRELGSLWAFGKRILDKLEDFEDHNSDEVFAAYFMGMSHWLAGREKTANVFSDPLEVRGYEQGWMEFEKKSGGSRSKASDLRERWLALFKTASEIGGEHKFLYGFGSRGDFETLRVWLSKNFNLEIERLESIAEGNRRSKLQNEVEEWKARENARIARIDFENQAALKAEKQNKTQKKIKPHRKSVMTH